MLRGGRSNACPTAMRLQAASPTAAASRRPPGCDACREWVETTTLGWGEMQEILGAAVAAFPWERRRATLFLLASPMGQRRALAPALHALSAGSALYNLTIDEWIHWPGHFLSLYQHCRYK